jgi:hypothetical protein
MAMLALLVPAAVTVAQTAPPEPALRRAPSPLVGYFIMFVLLVAIIAISIMPSKRSHQD